MKQRKRRYAASIGGGFLLLAAIGVVTVVVMSIRLTGQVLDNTKEKERFEALVRPVVMFNPAPFENSNDIVMTQLLLYSMWSALTSEKGSTYVYGDNQELIVPASDLDVAARNLFGDAIKLEHQTFGEIENTYSYEADKNIYNVPVNVQIYVYSPRVQQIMKNGEFYNLVVDYIPPDSAWTANFSGRGEAAPDKRMIYVMSKGKDGYFIVKLQDPPPELALSDEFQIT